MRPVHRLTTLLPEVSLVGASEPTHIHHAAGLRAIAQHWC
jgi:hypothetical protein